MDNLEREIAELDFLITYLKIRLNSSVYKEYYDILEKRKAYKTEKYNLLKQKERRDKLIKINLS